MPVDPAIGSLIQNIGIGLLTSNNPWAGLGRGVMSWQQAQAEDALRKQQQANINRQLAQDDKRLAQQADQFNKGQELTRQGWDREDTRAVDQRNFTASQAAANRDFEAEQAKQAYARQLGLAGVQNKYAMDRLGAQAAIAKSAAADERGEWQSGEYFDEQGRRGLLQTNAAGATRYMVPGTNQWVDGAPAAVQEPTKPMFGSDGPSLPPGVISKDYTNFLAESDAALSGRETLEDIARMREVSKNANVGTDLVSMTSRAIARLTGLGANDADSLLASDAGRAQLRAAIESMRGQGQITEKERDLLAQTIADPTKLSSASFQEVLNITENRTKQRMAMVDGYLKANGGTYKPGALWGAYKANWALGNAQPSSSLAPAPTQTPQANSDDALISKYLQ